jgi:hypothetical protein
LQSVSRHRPEAPLKLASRSVGVHFWALGVGRWALGVGRWVRGRVTPGGRVDDEVTLPGLRWPVSKPRSRASRRYSRRRCECPAGLAIAERWVFGRWVLGVGCWALGVGRWVLGVGCWVLGVGCWALGARQGRPRVQRLKGRWVALSPPVSRRPGWYTSPRPRRRRPQRGGNESHEPPPTP